MDSETSNDGSFQFSRVTFNDHSGQLWIVTILSLIYGFLGAMTRVYIKYRMFGFDDVLLAFATVRKLIPYLITKLTTSQVFHIAQAIAMFVGLNNGLGKFNSITAPEQWATSSKVSLV